MGINPRKESRWLPKGKPVPWGLLVKAAYVERSMYMRITRIKGFTRRRSSIRVQISGVRSILHLQRGFVKKSLCYSVNTTISINPSSLNRSTQALHNSYMQYFRKEDITWLLCIYLSLDSSLQSS